MIITVCWPVVNLKLTGVPGHPHLSFMGSLFETQTRIHKTIRSNTCPQAWWGGHFYSLSPGQVRDELLCSPGRASTKFHQPDPAPGASFPSSHRPDCFCPHRHHVSTSWAGRSKGKPRSSTEVFKYQLWNFSHQPSKCLTAYMKQTSFGGVWKVPVVVCSANQQGRHISENRSIVQVSALNQDGKQFKPKGSQVLSLTVRVVIAFLPLQDLQTVLKGLSAF